MNYYYYDGLNEEFSGNDSLEVILKQFEQLPLTNDSFFGMINGDKKILQFAWEDEKWLADMPIPEQKASMQKFVEKNDCISMISDFYNGKTVFEGMELSEWSSSEMSDEELG